MTSPDSKKTLNYNENFQNIIKKNYKKRFIYMENDIVFIMNNDTMNILKKDLIVGCTISKMLYIHLRNMPPLEININDYDKSFGIEVIAFIYNLLEMDSKSHEYYS